MARRRLPKFLPRAEIDQLAGAACKPRDRLIVLCGFYLGLRVSEIVALEVNDLDWDAGLCFLRRCKYDRDRAVPLPAKLLPELQAWVGGRKVGPVFPSPRGGGRLSIRAVQQLITRLAKRASITRRVTCHMLRHSYAQQLLRTGCSIMELRDLLGHSSIATTQVYLRSDPSAMRAAVDRL